jgi:hypothetical protein
MPSILIVQKNGDIKPFSAKSIALTDLYKKAGFKTQDDFKIHANWKMSVDDKPYHIHLFGKITGRANQENKFEFPPPVDGTLFFGSCVLVNILDNAIADLSEDEWEDIYEMLMGGFEDLDDADSSAASSDEMATDEELEQTQQARTKSGYAKDGFVVEDGEEEEEDDYDDDSEESYVPPSKKKKNAKPNTSSNTNTSTHTNETEPLAGYECANELEEEDYV